MTSRKNKNAHRDILARRPKQEWTEEDHKAMQEFMYGDENNPGERVSLGLKDADLILFPEREPPEH